MEAAVVAAVGLLGVVQTATDSFVPLTVQRATAQDSYKTT